MISKNKQSQLAGFRILLAIPTAFALLLMCSFTSQEETTVLLQNNLQQPTMQAVQSSLDNLQTLQQKPVGKKPIKKTIKDTIPPIIKGLDNVTCIGFGSNYNINGNEPFLVVEQNPEFNGGYEAMLKYLRENIHYPTKAKESKVQGTVYVQFVVGKTGKISNVHILRGIGSGCDEEALRVVKEMPNWISGRQLGQVVTVLFQIAVKFTQTAI